MDKATLAAFENLLDALVAEVLSLDYTEKFKAQLLVAIAVRVLTWQPEGERQSGRASPSTTYP
jgi:hypothetical protein